MAQRRGAPLIRREDYICSEEQDQIDRLERDRALLLRYVRAQEEMDAREWTAGFVVPLEDKRRARRALIDAGLLGGDDE